MRKYLIYGQVVESRLTLPAPIAPVGQVTDVRLIVNSDTASYLRNRNFERFHRDENWPACLQIYTAGDAFLLETEKGEFRFRRNGAVIDFSSRDDLSKADLGILFERVLFPLFRLLSSENTAGIHGSAVSRCGRSWMFIGESGAGKSTTAYELVRRSEGDLMADDIVISDVEEGVVLPGAAVVWLTESEIPDSVRSADTGSNCEKRWFELDSDLVETEPVPLAGMIRLSPVGADGRAEGGQPIGEVRKLGGSEKLSVLLEQAYDFQENFGDWRRRRFENVSQLARETPVYEYRYRRSEDGSPEHVEGILELIDEETGVEAEEA